SDTHGYLYPNNFASKQPQNMGLLSMRFPKDENTLVIDGGDTIQGSPLTYFCKQNHIDLPVADAMNDRGYDYITLGNHDFNNGREYLKKHLEKLNAKCLCANVEDHLHELPIGSAVVHTLGNGLRVGLVGVVTNWVNLWEKPENLADFTVSDPFIAAKRAIEGLECDVLVGIYHGGIEKDLASGKALSRTDENIACRLCEELPFDLLLTGHQHIAMANKEWNGVHIVQTPCNSASYVKVTMDEDRAFHSELCVPPSEAALTQDEKALWERVNIWLDTPIGSLSKAIWPGEKLDMALNGSAIADFFNTVQLWASGADISCAALSNELRGFDSEVTVRDVVASYVYSNTLVVMEVTGDIVKRALEQCARYFAVDENGCVSIADSFLRPKVAHFNYDYFSGIEYTFDLSKPEGERVVSLTRNGREVKMDEKMRLVMCDYRATGAGDFEFYTECPRVKEIQTEVCELILNYFFEFKNIEIGDAHPIRSIGYN
ncbi:MAG: bifunctional metallophosphatase/5'-nucleotidase, partial [Clostridia bacterium]|nr:bifunctional metallophosphatase/5'-nucleotidase [Clostridia bacterium]